MPFEMLGLKSWITCAAVGVMVYAIARTRNARVRGIVTSVPIPLSLILWSQLDSTGHGGMSMTAGQILSMTLLTGFFWSNWLLYAKAGFPIAVSLVLTVAAYVNLGALTREATLPPLWFAVGYAAAWLGYIVWLYDSHHEPVAEARIPPEAKALGTFAVCVFFFSLRNYIGPALATAPLVSCFSVVECRKILRTICFEFTRNALGLVAFIVCYWLVPETAPFAFRLGAAWLGFGLFFGLGRLLTRRGDGQVPAVPPD